MNAPKECVAAKMLRMIDSHTRYSFRIGMVLFAMSVALLPMDGRAATLQAVVLTPAIEGGSGASIAVQLAFDVAENPANCQISGTLTTQDGSAVAGSDYQPVTAPFTLNITTGDTSVQQQLTIPIVDDTIAEPEESYDAVINATVDPLVCPLAVNTITPTSVDVADDDQGSASLTFSATVLSVDENAGTAAVQVTLSGAASVQSPFTATVDVATQDGSATSDTDFTGVATTLTFDQSQTVQTVTVQLTDDSVPEGAESFAVVMSNAAVALPDERVVAVALPAPTLLVTILDDDNPLGAGDDITLAATAGATVSATFAVAGTPPITLAATLGSLSPSVLNAPGNATYSYAVPADTAAGTTLTDTVTATDQNGNVATKRIVLQVNAPAARDLTDIPSLTPNQLALATWFDDFCPRLAAAGAATSDQQDLFGICANLRDPATTNGQVVGALDAINPEPLLSAAPAVLRLSAQQHGNLEQRINSLRSGATGVDLAGLALNIDGKEVPGAAVQSLLDTLTGGAASADDFGRWGLFVNGRMNFGEQDETQNQTGFDFDTIGLTSGVDYRLRDNFVIGAAVGYSKINADFDHATGHLDIESWNASLFGTYFSADKFYVDASLNYGDNGYDSARHIVYTDVGGTVDRTARSDSNGMETSGGIAAGYDFGYGAWTFGPHVGSYYYDVDVSDFHEKGAGGLNMIVGDQNAQSLTLNAGGHVSYAVTPGWGVFVPHLRVDFVHEFEDSRELIGIRVAADPFESDPSDPTPSIVLETDRPDPDYVVWSAGVSVQLANGISGFTNYQSTTGYSDLTLTEMTFGLRWERSF